MKDVRKTKIELSYPCLLSESTAYVHVQAVHFIVRVYFVIGIVDPWQRNDKQDLQYPVLHCHGLRTS